MTNIFISHSPRDLRHLKSLQDHLVSWNYNPWLDPDPRPGRSWRFEIDEAIRGADAVIVIITPASADSVYVTYEWALALANKIQVLPIIFKHANMHPRLSTLAVFDAASFKEIAHFWDYFRRELRRLVPPSAQAQYPPQAQAQALYQPIQAPQQQIPQMQPQAQLQAQPAYPVDRRVMPSQPGHWIVVRRGPELNRMYNLHKTIMTLGRDAANDIAIVDEEVSRYHLRLSKQTNGFYAVEDLNSTNGTFVNEVRIQQMMPLMPGQTLRLGTTIILTYETIAP